MYKASGRVVSVLTNSDSDHKVTFTNPKLTNMVTWCLELT